MKCVILSLLLLPLLSGCSDKEPNALSVKARSADCSVEVELILHRKRNTTLIVPISPQIP